MSHSYNARSSRSCLRTSGGLAGERHLFLSTSQKYPAAIKGEKAVGVELVDGVTVARGIDGKSGSGVYSVDQNGESAEPKVEKLLAGMRKGGMVEKGWEHLEGEWERITGLMNGIE